MLRHILDIWPALPQAVCCAFQRAGFWFRWKTVTRGRYACTIYQPRSFLGVLRWSFTQRKYHSDTINNTNEMVKMHYLQLSSAAPIWLCLSLCWFARQGEVLSFAWRCSLGFSTTMRMLCPQLVVLRQHWIHNSNQADRPTYPRFLAS